MAALAFDKKAFLDHYWQRRPLLLKNTIDGFIPPIDADELAGLAMEELVESRIIEQTTDNWQLQRGPFSGGDFDRPNPWTLLVQAVDLYYPEVEALRQLVDFIPQWRIDDVMVSYAVDGGSVGPHYDNYDVFLLQGEGQRLWRLGQQCDESTPLLPHADLRILQNFECEVEYLLGPGDILYVPPGVAHWGIAQGECTTFSIGFRAPRIQELVSRHVDAWLEQHPQDLFYRDAQRPLQLRAGEILKEDISSARAQLLAALTEDNSANWFGELVTEPQDPQGDLSELPPFTEQDFSDGAGQLELLPQTKLAWTMTSELLLVFCNGHTLPSSKNGRDMLMNLCAERVLCGAALAGAMAQADCAILLKQLWDLGCFTYD